MTTSGLEDFLKKIGCSSSQSFSRVFCRPITYKADSEFKPHQVGIFYKSLRLKGCNLGCKKAVSKLLALHIPCVWSLETTISSNLSPQVEVYLFINRFLIEKRYVYYADNFGTECGVVICHLFFITSLWVAN